MPLINCINFFTLVVYIFAALYILFENYKSLVNILAFLFSMCFAIWTFGVLMMWGVPENQVELVYVFQNIASLGWISFPAVFLGYTLHLYGPKKVVRSWLGFGLAGAISIFFIYQQWTGNLILNYLKTDYGWFPIWSQSIFADLFLTYYMSVMLVSLTILVYLGIVLESSLKMKKISLLLGLAIVFSLIAGTVTDIIIPRIIQYPHFPQLAHIFPLVWVFAITYVNARYRFLAVNPITAADKIFTVMPDIMILLDEQDQIIEVNPAVNTKLGYTNWELQGQEFSNLLSRKSDYATHFQADKALENQEINFKTKTGQSHPFLVSCAQILDKRGHLIGRIIVASDIQELHAILQKLRLRLKKLNQINKSFLDREQEIISLKKKLAN